MIESDHQVCDSITKSFVILIYFISNNSLVLVFLFDMANTILFNNKCLEDVRKRFTAITTVLIIYVSFIANILSETPSVRNPHHIETNQQTCDANLLTGFYMTRVPTKGASLQALVKEF